MDCLFRNWKYILTLSHLALAKCRAYTFYTVVSKHLTTNEFVQRLYCHIIACDVFKIERYTYTQYTILIYIKSCHQRYNNGWWMRRCAVISHTLHKVLLYVRTQIIFILISFFVDLNWPLMCVCAMSNHWIVRMKWDHRTRIRYTKLASELRTDNNSTMLYLQFSGCWLIKVNKTLSKTFNHTMHASILLFIKINGSQKWVRARTLEANDSK